MIIIFCFIIAGLNILMMLRHDTLVLTIDALNHIQDKLIYQLHRADRITGNELYNHSSQVHLKPAGFHEEWK